MHIVDTIIKKLDFIGVTEFFERFYKEKSIFEFCKFSKEGQWGTLVFTGQIDDYPEAGNRKKAKEKGKYHEFVFFDKSDPNEWVVKDDVFTSFLHAHQALNRENLGNWDFWKQQFDNGEKVPVFFLLDKIPNSTSIESFGLAFMYRIAFKNTPANILKQNNQVKPDLAEVIFGSTRKGLELKGRVQFGHAKWVSGQQKETYKVLLPSPRSTYYPFYVKQEVGPDGRVSKENYSHFDSAKATLAGWKRYPIANPLHSNFQGHEQDQKGTGPNEKMLTNFKPYEKGAVFKGAIYFHNLKKIEIGALLSALTFHGQQDCLHQLGMGKPLGFGKTRIQTHLVGLSHSQEAYLAAFEEEMDHFLKTEPWRETHQVLELLTLASKVNVGIKEVEEQLEYMPLENFAKVKNAKEGLLPFSRIPGVKKNSLAGYVAPEWKQTLEAERAARLDGFNQLAEQTTKQTTEQQQAQVEKEAKQKAKEDQKKQLLAAEEEKREAQRTAELEAIKALEKQELAAALKDNAAEEILACKDWDALRKFMENTYFKRLSVDALQPEHQPAVLQKLQALMELNNRQRKELSDTAGKHGPWKKHIEKWVGEATATEWKKQMNLQ
jgi:flagellar biosynthesis GTPase FlhF